MIRRRRPQRETAFSFDSFLDLVTNVVGIIIRLILVVWVGARSYTGLPAIFHTAHPPTVGSEKKMPEDPLERELALQRASMADAERRLLEQLRQLDLTEKTGKKTAEEELSGLEARRQKLDHEKTDLERTAAGQGKTDQVVALSLTEIQKRRERLTQEIRELEKLPPLRKTLHYRTPVSVPVHSEEWHFECRQGRVSFVDIATMLDDVRRDMQEKSKLLKTQWHVADVTEAVGAFRLQYILERRRDTLDAAFGSVPPEANANFGYGLSEYIVEPVEPIRGESLAEAMKPNSEFRHIADGLSPALATVTLWVYPDSFALYRQLRDYLADRDITVAGRPLPEGVPITCSRRGSVSRGQ
jgi:hypothetical protein